MALDLPVFVKTNQLLIIYFILFYFFLIKGCFINFINCSFFFGIIVAWWQCNGDLSFLFLLWTIIMLYGELVNCYFCDYYQLQVFWGLMAARWRTNGGLLFLLLLTAGCFSNQWLLKGGFLTLPLNCFFFFFCFWINGFRKRLAVFVYTVNG